jgi:hypothetical protein
MVRDHVHQTSSKPVRSRGSGPSYCMAIISVAIYRYSLFDVRSKFRLAMYVKCWFKSLKCSALSLCMLSWPEPAL